MCGLPVDTEVQAYPGPNGRTVITVLISETASPSCPIVTAPAVCKRKILANHVLLPETWTWTFGHRLSSMNVEEEPCLGRASAIVKQHNRRELLGGVLRSGFI